MRSCASKGAVRHSHAFRVHVVKESFLTPENCIPLFGRFVRIEGENKWQGASSNCVIKIN